MAIGRFGSLPFICSTEKMQTFSGLTRSREIRYEEHNIINKMPMLEFVGYGLFKAEFTMRFDMSLGVAPSVCLEKLQAMMQNKMYKWLMVGEQFLGRYVINNIQEQYKAVAGDGTILVAEVKVSLVEWSRGR